MTIKPRNKKPQHKAAERKLTERQLAQLQERKKRLRKIVIKGAVILLGVVAFGVATWAAIWYFASYRPLHQIVISVNGAKFDMTYYIETLKAQGVSAHLPAQFNNAVADSSLKKIEQNELVKQGASALGITVSDSEVNKRLSSLSLPDDDVHRDSTRAQLLMNKVKEEYLSRRIPSTDRQVHMMAMLLESERQAAEVRARLEKGEDFSSLAGELSLNSLSKQSKGDLGWHSQDVLSQLIGSQIPGEYGFSTEVGVLSQPVQDTTVSKAVGYWLIEVLERQADTKRVHVQAMLLGSEQEAQDVRARLVAGEDFATLAKQLSQLPNAKINGGDLGFISQNQSQDQMGALFSKFAFGPDVEPGTLSQVIRDDIRTDVSTTKGGYWLIRVLERADDRKISDSDRELLKSKALDDWVASLWAASKNKIDDRYLDWSKKAWAIEQAAKGSKKTT